MKLKHCTDKEFALNCCQQRGDLWTLNYTKTVRPGIAGGAHDVLRPLSLMGIHPPHSLPLNPSDVMSRLTRGPRSFPELVPPLFRPETEKCYYSEYY